ncbi:YjbH domain-containing protein [Cognatishimia sp. F0-27]|nr:YjbH domain-containing protein [Cognatishimia sp. F0-27]
MIGKRFSRTARTAILAALMTTVWAAPSASEGRDAVRFNSFGLPGLIDMPTAEAMPDAEIAGTFSALGDSKRRTLAFQLLPRLTVSFRYASIANFDVPSAADQDTYYDRSFDLQYQILKEGKIRPAVAIGLRDFIGTGVYSGEYLVATKTLAPGLKATGGLGWGRFAGTNPIGNTGSRPEVLLGEGGVPTYDRWFRGDVSAFGGLSYAVNDRLSFKVEYSPDAYTFEETRGEFERNSPWNFGVDYRFQSGVQLSLYHAYGNEIGAQLSFATNPKTLGVPGGIEKAPLPVERRALTSAASLGWVGDETQTASVSAELRGLAVNEGLVLEAVQLDARRATVRVANERYGAPAQAFGRLARAMSRTLPDSIEEFVIIPVVSGMPMSAVVMRRSDIERHENDAADVMLARTSIIDAFGRTPPADAQLYPKFTWGLSPYFRVSAFDPDNPLRGEFGARLSASWSVTPNVVLSGSVTKAAFGNLDKIKRRDESELPRVRTDFAEYNAQGDPSIERLQLALYGRPGKNLYGRFTVGYLERMYAGASAEMLWKPVDSRLALGAELNYVLRREFDQMFGVTDNITTDPVTGIERSFPKVNGHVSAYYDFGNGFHGQLDMGRYLAGDYGATVSLDREFANGFRVGAYATLTDVSADDFGEGSFDKGIRITLPLSTLIGKPSRVDRTVNIKPITRDGGARVQVSGRLYNKVRDYHEPKVAESWGRFWR